MVIEPATLPDLNALDQAALRALILALYEQQQSRDIQIKHLELLVIELRMTQFGRKNEKLDNQIEQPGLSEHLARAALLAATFCE
jgi:hypothetical protein